MAKLIKDHKNLMTLAKCQNFLDTKRLEKLNHTKPHIIDLDTDYDENIENQIVEMQPPFVIAKNHSINPQSQMQPLIENNSSIVNMMRVIDRNIDAMVLYKKNIPFLGQNQGYNEFSKHDFESYQQPAEAYNAHIEVSNFQNSNLNIQNAQNQNIFKENNNKSLDADLIISQRTETSNVIQILATSNVI